jgi:single-strand DNA-binding protein
MASVNKVILVGYCGRDPEIRYAPSGDAIANLSIATSEKFKDRSTGETRESTECHRLVFFGRLAEIVGEYVRTGTAIYVEGKIRSRKWTDKEGFERQTTEIVCNSMTMLGGKDNPSDKDGDQSKAFKKAVDDYAKASGHSGVQRLEDMSDDIPW